MVGVVGMFSIHGGSSTWLFAASIDGFGGFLFMLKRKGRSGGFFGGRTPLSSNPSSQADFFLSISLRHLERKVRNSACLLSGMLLFVMWLNALVQLLQQSPLSATLCTAEFCPSMQVNPVVGSLQSCLSTIPRW